MEGETNRDASFPESLDSPEGSPSSNVGRLASEGNRHGSVESHDGSNVGTSNVQEQTFDDDAVPQSSPVVTEEILVRGTSLTTSSSDQLSSSSGVGRLLSRRFTFWSVRNVLQNSVHFRVLGNDSRSLSISLRVASSDQQRNTITRGSLTPLRNLAPRSTGLSEEQIRGRLKERKHTVERCSICLVRAMPLYYNLRD